MALKEITTDKYIKVIDISLTEKYIKVKEFETEEVRENPSDWNKIGTKTHYLGADFDTEFAKNASNVKSIVNNIFTKAYAALKVSTYPEPDYLDV